MTPKHTFISRTKTDLQSWSLMWTKNSEHRPALILSTGNCSSQASGSTAWSGCNHLTQRRQKIKWHHHNIKMSDYRASRPPGVSALLSMKSRRNICLQLCVTTPIFPLRTCWIDGKSIISPRESMLGFLLKTSWLEACKILMSAFSSCPSLTGSSSSRNKLNNI